MPYLQLDIPRSYPPEIKCALAGELGTIYAMVMETKAEKVVVSVRELSSSVLLYSSGSEVVSIVIWELWQNGQYVELSAFGVMLIAALFVIVIIAQLVGRRFGVSES